MPAFEVVRERLSTQCLVAPHFRTVADAVTSLCAVQAQDYVGSLWGVCLRTKGASKKTVERAISERAIVRTWPMRGTLHFVASEDVRWMLALLTPRVFRKVVARHRQLDLDAAVFQKSRARLEAALAGGGALTRPELYGVLERAKISTTGQRGVHIIIELAMRGVLCFGAPKNDKQAFVLLDEWIPKSRVLDQDEALGELARRYFTGHGPATTADFAWWSGLSLTEARRGLEIGGGTLKERVLGTSTYFSGPSRAIARSSSVAHLLPAYDEYTVAYRDRSAFLAEGHAARAGNGIFSPVVTINGRVVGTWRRRVVRDRIDIAAALFSSPRRIERAALERAAAHYGVFWGLPAVISYEGRSPRGSAVREGP